MGADYKKVTVLDDLMCLIRITNFIFFHTTTSALLFLVFILLEVIVVVVVVVIFEVSMS